MAEAKNSFLDTSYYGPSVPSREQAGPTTSSRRGGLGCEPYDLLCIAFKALTTTLITIGIVVLVLWLIFQPDDLKVYVDSATLTRFDLAPNHTLYYNLTLDMSLRNPNKKISIYYERLEADVYYGGSRLGFKTFAKFNQDHKSTVMLQPSFGGQQLVTGDSIAATFNREKGEGYFHICVKMYTTVRLKTIVVKSVRYKPEVDCYLRIPAPGNASSAGGFTRTKCNVDSFL